MIRRDFMKRLALGTTTGALGILGGQSARMNAIAETYSNATKGLPPLKITNVKSFLIPYSHGGPLVVKVETSEPGLYGLGSAGYTQRPFTVKAEVDEYLAHFAKGKSAENIEDMWQSYFVSSYFRNGAVTNAANSGLDMALWDIMGKRANMPVYKLLGGKSRFAVECYKSTGGRDFTELEDNVQKLIEEGYRVIKIQPGVSDWQYFPGKDAEFGIPEDRYQEVGPYIHMLPRAFEHLRNKFGDQIGFLHDHVNRRVPPIEAIDLVKKLEQYHPFFLEDPFTNDDIGYFRILREQSSCPIAMGENFTNPQEWIPLISERLIDFIRCHMSTIGGLTPAIKLAHYSESYNVRTAWHGPGNVTPVGDAANAHLDLAVWNFGIQEFSNRPQEAHDIFPGCPVFKKDKEGYGYMYVNEAPGLGVDINEKAALKLTFGGGYMHHPRGGPYSVHPRTYRRGDGTFVRP
ncbi:enolase C-terminal domain-like protein [Candidatus Latescibacterota bacterium]